MRFWFQETKIGDLDHPENPWEPGPEKSWNWLEKIAQRVPRRPGQAENYILMGRKAFVWDVRLTESKSVPPYYNPAMAPGRLVSSGSSSREGKCVTHNVESGARQ